MPELRCVLASGWSLVLNSHKSCLFAMFSTSDGISRDCLMLCFVRLFAQFCIGVKLIWCVSVSVDSLSSCSVPLLGNQGVEWSQFDGITFCFVPRLPGHLGDFFNSKDFVVYLWISVIEEIYPAAIKRVFAGNKRSTWSEWQFLPRRIK